MARTLEDRFWSKVAKQADGCWLWIGALTTNGYGHLRVGSSARMAHRISYELAGREVPAAHDLDHLCRVRNCVNPDHLEPVTHRENIMRGQTHAAANAAKTTCVHGHPFDYSNTRISSKGRRICRQCTRDWKRAHRG